MVYRCVLMSLPALHVTVTTASRSTTRTTASEGQALKARTSSVLGKTSEQAFRRIQLRQLY